MADDLDIIATAPHPDAAKLADWLRSLSADEQEARDSAFLAFIRAIDDDALLAVAGGPLVRVLIAMVANEDVPQRARLVSLLADLAVFAPHGEFVTACSIPPAPLEPRREALGKTLRDGVKAGFDTYIDLFEDDDDTVRTAVPVLLAMLPEMKTASADTLRERLAEETDPWSSGSALIALGMLDRYASSDEDRGPFEQLLSQKDAHVLVQFGAASAFSLTADAPPGDRVVNELLSAVEGADTPVPRLVWNEGDLRSLAIRILGAAASQTRDTHALDKLLELSRKWTLLPSTLINLLVGVFPGARPRPAETVRLASQLAPAQRFLLEYLVKTDALAWDPFQRVDWHPVERMQERAGLPVSGDELRRWLGVPSGTGDIA